MLKKLFVHIYHFILITALAGLVCNFALAMGLGDINVLSKLNEPLDVEIEITDTGSSAIDDIMVRNAPRKTYQKAHLSVPEAFNKVHFKVIKKPDGSVVAKLTSRKIIKEPFITFIADLRWRNGHINREYTFLLDPPEFVKKHSQPRYRAKKPLAHRKPLAHKKPLAYKKPLANKKPFTNKRPVVKNNNRTVSSNRTSKNYSYLIANHQNKRSYTTRRSDTLWKIAQKHRPDSAVSTWQTMQAIFVLNPDAFINGNIDLLKQHQTLALPDGNEVRQINGKAAIKKAAITKTSHLEEYALKPQKSATHAIEPKERKKSSVKNTSVKNQSESANPDQARLKIIPPTETLLNKPVSSKKDLLLINKALKTSMDTIKLLQNENNILVTQVDQLNNKIKNIDAQNIELSNKIVEITRLLKGIRAAEAIKSTTTDAPTGTDANNTDNSNLKKTAQKQSIQNKQSELSRLSMDSPAKADNSRAAALTVNSTINQSTINQPVSVQGSFIQELMTHPVMSLALLILAIILLTGIYIAVKKQKARNKNPNNSADYAPTVLSSIPQTGSSNSVLNKESIIQPSVTNSESSTPPVSKPPETQKNDDDMDFFEYFEKKINAPDEKVNTSTEVNTEVPGDKNERNNNAADVDFSLDISEADIQDYKQSISTDDNVSQNSVNRSAAETLSEVDTYLAYGNYDVAEEILTSEIIKSPLNKDLNLKLFECYALANKRYEFIQHLKQVINLLNENMVLRHRVENIYQQTWNETLDITQLF